MAVDLNTGLSHLVERYEYSPYGERKVFVSAGANDPGCYAPTLVSKRRWMSFQEWSEQGYSWITTLEQPFGLCEFGHQGLPHEEGIDNGSMIQNRHRVLHASLGRFIQRDPVRYSDGMSLYQYTTSNPSNFTDIYGLCKDGDCRIAVVDLKLLGGSLEIILGGGSSLSVPLTGNDAVSALMDKAKDKAIEKGQEKALEWITDKIYEKIKLAIPTEMPDVSEYVPGQLKFLKQEMNLFIREMQLNPKVKARYYIQTCCGGRWKMPPRDETTLLDLPPIVEQAPYGAVILVNEYREIQKMINRLSSRAASSAKGLALQEIAKRQGCKTVSNSTSP